MHQAQKKAVFAMIDSIESQLRYVKSLILMDEAATVAPTEQKPITSSPSEYLKDDEEELLDKIQEEQRQKMIEEEARVQSDWARQRKIIREEASF